MVDGETKPIGGRTDKSTNRFICQEYLGQALQPIFAEAKSASSASVDTIYWDNELPGFGVRAYATGRRVYFVQYRERGRTRRRTIAVV